MSDNDKSNLLAPSVEYEEEDYEEQNTATSIQIRDGQTIDPYFEDSGLHDR